MVKSGYGSLVNGMVADGPGAHVRACLRSYADLSDEISSPKVEGRSLVAVDGRGASGKSTFAQRLRDELLTSHDSVEIVSVDDFYRPPGMAEPGPYGLFDLARLGRQVVDPYLCGERVSYRPYDWNSRTVSGSPRDVGVPEILILEGIFSMSRRLGKSRTFGIWVEAPSHARLARGLARDGEAAREVWTGIWMPREDEYVRKERPDLSADVVVDGGRPSPPGLFWCDGPASSRFFPG